MEHEVYVPFAVGAVRAALAEPERVARCIPGLQPDASETVSGDGVDLRGRLRVRIGGSSITYRGRLRLTHERRGTGDGADETADGTDGTGDERYTVRGEGTEARGDGSVELTLTVVARPAGDGEGTTLACTAELRGAGRITEFEERQRHTAGRRLLDRFAGELAESMTADPVAPADAAGTAGTAAGDTTDAGDTVAAAAAEGGSTARTRDTGEPEEPREAREQEGEPRVEGIFEVEIPPPSLDPESDDVFDDGLDEAFGDDLTDEELDEKLGGGLGDGPAEEFGAEADDGLGGFGDDLDEEPSPATAEAAHARRTMIGRSAEEVDHAPPRGRYAPVPPPESASSTAAVLRWAAPAAALVLASAVVVGRVLKRRR